MGIEIGRVAAILLAGGRATRFGDDKLAAMLDGVPLGLHAARTLADMPFAQRVVVTGATRLEVGHLDFDQVQVTSGTLMSGSVRAGVTAVQVSDCDACLIALADMPLVPEAHFAALLATHAGIITATALGGRRMVPAVFARSVFPRLLSLEGDRGAAPLLREGDAVAADPQWLVDIDTPADLDRLAPQTRC